jgi:hypothetical protein
MPGEGREGTQQNSEKKVKNKNWTNPEIFTAVQ